MPRAAQVLLALVLGSSFASCGLTDGSSAEGESRTLRVLYESDERSLYPAMEDVPRFLVFHPLVRYRSLPDAFCWRNPEPALAARWTPTDGFRTWMIELREDARWHDGEPFTAHDMAFTVELWKHPDVQHWAAAKIDSVSVLGERTVRIFFDRMVSKTSPPRLRSGRILGVGVLADARGQRPVPLRHSGLRRESRARSASPARPT
jgi:ABC-type transport system substrate-binding protein